MKILIAIRKTHRSMYASHMFDVTLKSDVKKKIRVPIIACHKQRIIRVNIQNIAYLSMDVKYEIVGLKEKYE